MSSVWSLFKSEPFFVWLAQQDWIPRLSFSFSYITWPTSFAFFVAILWTLWRHRGLQVLSGKHLHDLQERRATLEKPATSTESEAVDIDALAVPDLQNLTERGHDLHSKPAWSLDCEISVHNLHPTQGLDDVRLRILSVSPPMVASPAHHARTQDATLRRIRFAFTDIPADKPLLGDQTGHVRIFNATRHIKFSESRSEVWLRFSGTWPDNMGRQFVPDAEHLLTVEVTGSGVGRQEGHFQITFSTDPHKPVFVVTRLIDLPDFAVRKRRAIYESVAEKLATFPPVQFAGLKCLQDARADTLEDNNDLVWVCDNLVRDGYEHPFYYFDEHVPSKGWLILLVEARKDGIDFADDMATLQWFMERHLSG